MQTKLQGENAVDENCNPVAGTSESPPQDVPDWFTIGETAKLIGMTERNVYRLRKKGQLTHMASASGVRISRESIERHLRRPVVPKIKPSTPLYIDSDYFDSIRLELQHATSEAKALLARAKMLEDLLTKSEAENEALKKKLRAVIADANNSGGLFTLLFGKKK